MTDPTPVLEAERVASRLWDTDHDHLSTYRAQLIRHGWPVAPTEQQQARIGELRHLVSHISIFDGPWLPPSKQVRPERIRELGTEVIERLRELASLAPGWDGADADPIEYSTAFSALVIAVRMSKHTADPSVAPMVDGSLILRWTFEDGAALEIVIEEGEDFPTYAMIERVGEVEELALEDEAALIALLVQRGRHDDLGLRRAVYSF